MTYSGGIAGVPVPNGNLTSGNAIPGNDISDGGPGLVPEKIENPVPEDQRHLFESGHGENPTKPPMNYPGTGGYNDPNMNPATSPNGGLHHQSYVQHDWSRQDHLDLIAKMDALNHKFDHVLEHFHANQTWTANLGGGHSLTFKKDSAG
ncbi:MAG: hypothetical protein CMA59_00740 [Euryarchaeota archaeon]|jgi:hypothetical protein|nr:hypothetical protein [Euryarchaeota archaeon]|tara:strand:- start:3069 stop:3515 length:447 start_codon:yes stop_codon:yes gene_type:complete